MLVLPSHCLLITILIWIELKNVKMADLFDLKWDEITYNNIEEKDFQLLDNEIQSIFDSYKESITNDVSNNFELFIFF